MWWWLWGGAGDSPRRASGTGWGLDGELVRKRGRDHALVVWRAEGRGPGSQQGLGGGGVRGPGGAGQDAGVQELGIHAVVPRSVLGTHWPARILHA